MMKDAWWDVKGSKFCHPEAAFWMLIFKLFTGKRKTQREPLTLSPFLPKSFRQRTQLLEGDLMTFPLAQFELSRVNKRTSGRCLLARYPLCPIVSQSLGRDFPAKFVLSSSATCKLPILTFEIYYLTPPPPLFPFPEMSYMSNVASLSLEFLWIYHVYVNSPCACIELYFLLLIAIF